MNRMSHGVWILLASAGLGVTAMAQEKPAATSEPAKLRMMEKMEQERAATAERAAKTAERRVNIEFPGGKLREYVASMREATRPESVNVVAPESLLNMRLGEISLRDVDVQTAVKALEWAAEPRGTMLVQIIGPNSFGVSNGRVEQITSMPQPAPVAQIQVLSLRDVTEPLPGEPANMRTTVDPDVVITAVRTALGAGGEEGAELKYHSDSGLLIVRGTPMQIAAASSVLDRMQNDMRARRKALKEAMAGQANLDEFRAEVEKQAVREQLLAANLARAQEDAAKLQAMRDQGVASAEDAASARATLDRAKAELETSRIERAMAQAKLASIERRVAEAATREARAGEGGTIPEGRSAVTYGTSLKGKELEGALSGMKTFVERVTGREGSVELNVAGGTFTVVADRDAQVLVRRVLIDPANPGGGPFSVRGVRAEDRKMEERKTEERRIDERKR